MLQTHAPDPYRPRVRVLASRDGTPIDMPYDIDLWDAPEDQPQAIQAPLDPGTFGIDPLAHLEPAEGAGP